jgi:hypothetical protein
MPTSSLPRCRGGANSGPARGLIAQTDRAKHVFLCEGLFTFHIIAVSGEITLHHDRIHVQVCQPATGADSGILIRTCEGRRDYTGGRNHFVPLSLLDDIPALAVRVRSVMAAGGGLCAGTVRITE